MASIGLVGGPLVEPPSDSLLAMLHAASSPDPPTEFNHADAGPASPIGVLSGDAGQNKDRVGEQDPKLPTDSPPNEGAGAASSPLEAQDIEEQEVPSAVPFGLGVDPIAGPGHGSNTDNHHVQAEVTLKRSTTPGVGYGLTVGGAVSQHDSEAHNCGIYVAKIMPGGPAHKGGVMVGWQILSINGQDTRKAELKDVTVLIGGNDTLLLQMCYNQELHNKFGLTFETTGQIPPLSPTPSSIADISIDEHKKTSPQTESHAVVVHPPGATKVTLDKSDDPSIGYGVTFGGLQNNNEQHAYGILGIFVEDIHPEGPARDHREHKLKQVLSINGTDTSSAVLNDLKTIIGSLAVMELVVISNPDLRKRYEAAMHIHVDNNIKPNESNESAVTRQDLENLSEQIGRLQESMREKQAESQISHKPDTLGAPPQVYSDSVTYSGPSIPFSQDKSPPQNFRKSPTRDSGSGKTNGIGNETKAYKPGSSADIPINRLRAKKRGLIARLGRMSIDEIMTRRDHEQSAPPQLEARNTIIGSTLEDSKYREGEEEGSAVPWLEKVLNDKVDSTRVDSSSVLKSTRPDQLDYLVETLNGGNPKLISNDRTLSNRTTPHQSQFGPSTLPLDAALKQTVPLTGPYPLGRLPRRKPVRPSRRQ